MREPRSFAPDGARGARQADGPLGAGRPYVDQDDVDAVGQVLLGGTLTQGPVVARFEAALGQATGAPHAVAVSSGCAALHLAYHALGVGPGRNVLASANAFAGTASAAQMCGGEVEFLDIDPRTGNLDMRRLEQRLEQGPLPHVVTATHFAGLPCDMEWLLSLKRRHDFLLVEDGAQALGARYRVEGRWYRPGEHPEIEATTLSFHAEGQITTGEGGAVLTHDGARAAQLRRLRAHGADLDSGPAPFAAALVELGFEARLTEFQAALGLSQLQKLPDFLEARREVALRYLAELRGYGLPHPGGYDESADREHAWHLFVIRCEPEERDALAHFLRERGIQARVHFPALPLEPWFRGRTGGSLFPEASAHARSALSLPLFPSLSDAEQGRVLAALADWRRARASA